MISLDQVFLLEQKVESAVAKIQQLQAENDALRNKCTELTNALSAKSEQLSSFENDQTQIEDGIKKALDRLNSIENSVLKAASQMSPNVQAAKPVITQQQEVKPVQPAVTSSPVTASPVTNNPVTQTPQIQAEVPPVRETPVTHEVPQEESFFPSAPSFDSMEPTENQPVENDFDEAPSEEDSTDGLGFDIF